MCVFVMCVRKQLSHWFHSSYNCYNRGSIASLASLALVVLLLCMTGFNCYMTVHLCAFIRVLRFVGLTNGGIEILLTLIQKDCAVIFNRHSPFETLSVKFLFR